MDAWGTQVLVQTDTGVFKVIDADDIYWMEAEGEETRIRLKGSKSLWDRRRLGNLEAFYQELGFLRIHRNHMVNLRRIREIRRRKGGRGWEVKLEPPVNRVLPVSAGEADRLFQAFGHV